MGKDGAKGKRWKQSRHIYTKKAGAASGSRILRPARAPLIFPLMTAARQEAVTL